MDSEKANSTSEKVSDSNPFLLFRDLWSLCYDTEVDNGQEGREIRRITHAPHGRSRPESITDVTAALEHFRLELVNLPKNAVSNSSKFYFRKLMRLAIMLEAEKHLNLGVAHAQHIKSAKAVSPARIDLAGGWSDTPPICIEVGGRVAGVAVRVDNEKPIGSRARRLDLLELRLVSLDCSSSEVKIESMDELLDFQDPSRPLALLKASIVCCFRQRCSHYSLMTLDNCLKETLGSGLKVETWSLLPSGSGLGTSSILACSLMSVVLTLMNVTFTKTDLVQLALVVEQMLTTGGGWQDQVHGIHGGFHMALNTVNTLKVDNEAIVNTDNHLWSTRLLLLYTGKARLAKNILEDVLHNWYSGNRSNIRHSIEDNIHLAMECRDKIALNDINGLAHCLNDYWTLKKRLGGLSVENEDVTNLINRVKHFAMGYSLAGAGGGGFLVLVLKSPSLRSRVESICEELQGVTCHQVQVDEQGLEISIEQ